ncbi:MAG: BrnT family toxin [Longimicrobiales bacterium]
MPLRQGGGPFLPPRGIQALSAIRTPTAMPHDFGVRMRVGHLDFIYTSVYTILFTWDPEKSDANLRDRGFDFEFASLIFQGVTLEKEDRRRAYGEKRVVAVGLADEVHLTVVYTDRNGAQGELIRRVISARRSNKRERRAYQNAFKS